MTNEVTQKTTSDEKNVSSSNGLEGKVPELRFSSYNNPWVAEKLSDFTVRITRKNNNNQTDLPLTISSKDGLVDQVTFFNKKVSSKDMSGYYLLQKGEFAYNKSYSNGFDFGSIKRLERYDMGALSTLYICFALTKYCSDFIRHYFDSLKWYRQIYIISAEGARNHGLLNVPTDDFFSTIHYISPDINEQEKIAAFLSLVDARIEKQRQLVESLKKYKRGLFSVYFKQFSDLKLIKLGEFAKIYQPATISQSEFTNGKYRVFGANGYIGYYDSYNHSTEQVTISCRGEKCGTVNFVGAYSWITGNSMVVNIDEQNIIDKRYLYHCLSNQNLKYLISGSAQPQIIRGDVAKHTIPLPPLPQQKSLSQFLDLIESLIYQMTNILEQTQAFKNGLLQRMFV